MDRELALVLVNKHIVKKGTEIEARHNARALGGINQISAVGSFIIDTAKVLEDGRLVFFVMSTSAGEKKVLLAENILTIEGQDPARFAASYEIQADGSDKPQGKRRGRIPKHLKTQMVAETVIEDTVNENEDFDDGLGFDEED